MSAKKSGDWGEALVAAYLRRRGYNVVAANYRCRFGEIDIIAQDGETLCFVEVKLRSNLSRGLPREYVTARKQERLRTAAQYYLSVHELDAPVRFDVAEVYTDPLLEREHTEICYLKNAF